MTYRPAPGDPVVIEPRSCTPERPCTADNRCDACALDLALLAGYCDPYAAIAAALSPRSAA